MNASKCVWCSNFSKINKIEFENRHHVPNFSDLKKSIMSIKSSLRLTSVGTEYDKFFLNITWKV